MKGVEIHHRNGRKFAIWQARLRDEMYADADCGNPMLWWMKEITHAEHDWLVCGVDTKRECLEAIEEAMKGK